MLESCVIFTILLTIVFNPLGMELYTCFSCSKSFTSIDALIGHMKVIHLYLRKFECKQNNCHRHFPTISCLRKHMYKQHAFFETYSEQKNNFVSKLNNSSNAGSSEHINTPRFTESDDRPQEKKSDLNSEILSFIGIIYSIPSLPRNLVQIIVEKITELVITISQEIDCIITSLNVEDKVKSEISCVFKDVKKTLASLSSEYLRLNYFQKLKSYVPPKTVFFGEYACLGKTKAGADTLVYKKAEGQIMDLRTVLKLFLELPTVYQAICSYMEHEQQPSDIVTSFMSAKLWQEMKTKLDTNKIYLPLVMYFDDFECCNPLGSKAGLYKIGAVYLSLACIPPEYLSLLENIFVAQLFYASDRKEYGNNKIFQHLINEFIFLENNGIEITIDNQHKRVYFKLVLVVGDNLGMNSVLGFEESFNAHYFCRFCSTPKDETKTQCIQNTSMLRTNANYSSDSQNQDHGVKETCVFNVIPNFNVVENVCCDLMHDVLEGICRYEIAYILDDFINKKKYFTLEHINSRIKYFKIAQTDLGSTVPLLKSEQISKRKLIIISASEMLALCYYLGILIGDLVPIGDKCWDLYILLHQILQILLDTIFSTDTLSHLTVLIQEHHELFCELFETPLKPKHHFLLHYPTIISKVGPLRYLWSMRFEGFHKILKSTANSVTSRKNILLTLAKKQQLRFSFRVLSKKGFSTTVDFSTTWDEISTLPQCEVISNLIIAQGYDPLNKNCFSVSWAKYNNIHYKINLAMQLTSENELPSFVIIKNIIIIYNKIYLFTYPLSIVKFMQHTQSYQISEAPNGIPSLLDLSALTFKVPLTIFDLPNDVKVILKE